MGRLASFCAAIGVWCEKKLDMIFCPIAENQLNQECVKDWDYDTHVNFNLFWHKGFIDYVPMSLC